MTDVWAEFRNPPPTQAADPWAEFRRPPAQAQTPTPQPAAPASDPWAEFRTQQPAPQPQAAQAPPQEPEAMPGVRWPASPFAQPVAPPAAPAPTAAAPPVEEGAPWQLPRGLYAGTLGSNPKMFGGALEGLGIMADAPSFVDKGLEIQKYGESILQQNLPRVPSYRNIPGEGIFDTIGRAGSYAAYSVGQGLGSTLPSLAAGGAAALFTANPFVGAAIGAFGPSYIQNYGDVYTSAKEDKDIQAMVAAGKLTPKQIALASTLAAIPMAALDVAGLESGLALAMKNDVKRGLLRKIMLGALAEGGTEAMQEEISDVTQRYLGSNKPAMETVHSLIDNFLGGALTMGVTQAAAAGVKTVKPAGVPEPTGDELTGIYRGLTGEPPPVQPATPAAPPEPAPPAAPITTAPIVVPPSIPPDQLDLPLGPPKIAEPPPAPAPPPKVDSPMAPAVSDFLTSNAIPATTLILPPGPVPVEKLLEEQQRLEQEIKARPGVNLPRLLSLLGPKLYGDPTNMADVSIKELVQNAFDAIKGVGAKGNIDIVTDPTNRTISVVDNGSGMTPQVLTGQFLEIAGTSKETSRASGGLGIAKMLTNFGNNGLKVVTMRNGKVTQLNTTGPELFLAANNAAEAPTAIVRDPTAADRDLFPLGHGTAVQITVPTHFEDSNKERKEINFPTYQYELNQLPVLRRSPLFEDIMVTVNGNTLPIGNQFPADEYTQFANVNFKWGDARIYVSKLDHKIDNWSTDHAHVLSNGLWQFSFGMPKKPGDTYGPKIQKTFFIDVNSKVAPEEAGYPFDLNRQQFARQALDDFGKIFKYISLLYQQSDFNLDVENFGEMQYLNFDPKTKTVSNSGAQNLKPPVPKMKTPATGIRQGDKVTVKEGKLIVNGRSIPDLKPEDLEKFSIDTSSLKIPQKQIKSNQVIYHDNSSVTPTGGPLTDTANRISVTQLGVQRFGNRFYEYMYYMGRAFKDLRDVVQEFDNYKGLRDEGVGISLDKGYRGVSIRIPFSASFLNPLAPRYTETIKAAIGMITTMTHELAHHTHRSEKDLAPVIQDIWTQLEAHPNFNFQAFKQRVVNIVNNYHDILESLNGVYENDYVESRGKRFKVEAGAEQIGDAGSLGDPTRRPVVERPNGSNLSEWVAAGNTGPGQRAGLGDGDATLTSAGIDPSFGIAANQRALDADAPGVPASPRQPEVQAIADKIDKAFQQTPPPAATRAALGQMVAHADTFNWFYKYMAGLLELISANPRFTPLLRYGADTSAMHREEATAQDAAQKIVKDWRRLGAQGENVTAFLDDMTNMAYLTPQEVRMGVVRQPTVAEIQALQRKHGVNARGMRVIDSVRKYFDTFLNIVSQNAIADARRLITDPVKAAQRITEIQGQVAQLKRKPYFPFMRFGRHYVTVRDPAGKVLSFETFERQGLKSAERVQEARAEEMRRQYGAANVDVGILPEQVEPLIGMPRTLLQHIKDRLKLTTSQLDAMEQLQYELSPSLSFKHRFQHKNYTPGYSKDFARSFARYAFHGARYNSRVKYVWKLEQHAKDARAVGGNKAHRIADYMDDHLDKTVLNAKGDFGIFKGAIFLWAMGYVPAAATQNLSQTPMITLPYLAAKYGDARAVSAIVKAISSATSYYRRASLQAAPQSAFELKAMEYAIQTGRLSETQAAELAALSNGNNLIYGTGGNAAQRTTVWIMEHAATMFETAEMFNRRIAFRAALDLAMQDSNSKEVQDAVNRYADEYNVLTAQKGFSPQQARAIVAANHAVEQTQFVYSRYARPRFMRGRIPGTVFVFKRYIQGVVMLMANNKKDVLPRYLLIAMLLGGMGGIPGYDDIKELVEAAFKWLGYNVDPETEVRRYIKQFTNGQVPPDLVLHGLSRRGFGLPALLDMMGSLATGRPGRGLLTPGPASNIPFPVLDRSKAITSGPLLPIEIGKLLQPAGSDKVDKTISEQAQRASGAVFSVGFNLYHAIMDQRAITDPKRWERAVPRMLGGVSKAFRTYTEERERGAGGKLGAATITNYDPRDSEQLMEIIALGLGYNNLRTSGAWDRIMAQQEHIAFIDMRRKGLMEQMNEARLGGNPQEIETTRQSILKFNDSIRDTPDRGKQITPDSLDRSMRTRQTEKIMKEMGLSRQRANIPIARDIQELFPENTIEIKRR